LGPAGRGAQWPLRGGVEKGPRCVAPFHAFVSAFGPLLLPPLLLQAGSPDRDHPLLQGRLRPGVRAARERQPAARGRRALLPCSPRACRDEYSCIITCRASASAQALWDLSSQAARTCLGGAMMPTTRNLEPCLIFDSSPSLKPFYIPGAAVNGARIRPGAHLELLHHTDGHPAGTPNSATQHLATSLFPPEASAHLAPRDVFSARPRPSSRQGALWGC
jgi:hypothetical protein